MTPLSASHPVSLAVDAIRSGKVTKCSQGHLHLPDTLRWPVATNNILFVRHFYSPLFEVVLDRCRPEPDYGREYLQRRIVVGQPGTGTSIWGFVEIGIGIGATSRCQTYVNGAGGT